MSRKRDVGMKIRAAREACGLSQQALADAIGAKSHQNVYNYERGDREPSFEVLERIAAATGKPLAWFFQDEDAAPAPAENPTPQPDMPSAPAILRHMVDPLPRRHGARAARKAPLPVRGEGLSVR